MPIAGQGVKSEPWAWHSFDTAQVASSSPGPKWMMNTTVGREITELTDMPNGLEVTNDAFESPASVVFQQAENRLHTIKALLVATLARR
jgi:hypothetical protein